MYHITYILITFWRFNMKNKLIVCLIAVVCVLICISPIMASENSMVSYSIIDDLFGTNHIDVNNLMIEKEKYQHTYADGKVDKHNNYYLDFNVQSDSDDFGHYSANITSYNSKNETLESFIYDINGAGDQRVELKDSKNLSNVSIIIKDDNGNVLYNNTTDSIKVTKDITEDKPVEKTSSSSSSSSGATYWASSNSDKFHKPSCEWAQKISSRNKVVFHSRDEALNSGYVPCQVCNP